MEQLNELEQKPAFSGWPMVIGWTAMIIFACHASTHMVGAGDTWVAMACGRHFINHGVDTVEPFSAKSHRPGPTPEEVKTWPQWAQKLTDAVGLETVKYWHPTGWVNQNWLTHVMFYWLTTLSPFADADTLSFNTLVYWKFALYIACVACIYLVGRMLRVHPWLCAVFACLAMFTGRSFLDIRPAGFSNLLVAIFMLALVLGTYRSHLYLWLIVPITVLWANLHGGYIYIFIMLVPFFVLHLLPMMPRRWTVSVMGMLTWMGLYVLAYKFLNHRPFVAPPIVEDRLFYMVILFCIASITITLAKSVNDLACYAVHIAMSLVAFVALFARKYFPELPAQYTAEVLQYMEDSRQSYLVVFAACVVLGIIMTTFRDRLVVLNPRALWHTAAVGAASFMASIIFNPFHLTNLTHTFQISISENAEGWRNVHEWWPAFAWTNPVGSGFAFLVMIVVAVGAAVLWLVSRLLVPKYLKPRKDELELQRKKFHIGGWIIIYGAAVFGCLAVMISFSLTDASIGNVFLCGIFAAIIVSSATMSIHMIYPVVLVVLFGLLTSGKDVGYHGRYIYPFMIIPAFAVMDIIASLTAPSRQRKVTDILYVIGTAAAALVLMLVIVNPFGYSSISDVLKLPWQGRIWSSQYEANLDLKYPAHLLQGVYIANAVAALAWLVVTSMTNAGAAVPAAETVTADREFKLPKIDLALLSICALTIYMAIRSRRFIPIAAFATCPFIAMIIDQTARTISSARNFHFAGRLAVPRMSRSVQMFFVCAGAAVTTVLGMYWALRFKHVYIDPWPTDARLNSAFIRMTASHAKPFDACAFMRLNKLAGNMFNYWTEGGFIAWGQDPDPETGRTPLQLFMDGRAQAAYDYKAYEEWSLIMFGGRVVGEARSRGREYLTPSEYKQLAEWLDEQFRRNNVWVVLMPAGEFNKPFVEALDRNPQEWPVVFLSDKEKMFVDVKTARGKELYEGIFTGETQYPDEYYRDVLKAHRALLHGTTLAAKKEGLDTAIGAFRKMPSRTPLHIVRMLYESVPELRPEVEAFFGAYFDDFLANKKKYLHEDGYHHKLIAVLLSLDVLEVPARSRQDSEKLLFYGQVRSETMAELEAIQEKRW